MSESGASFTDLPAVLQVALVTLSGAFGWGAAEAFAYTVKTQDAASAIDEANDVLEIVLADVDRAGCKELVDRLSRGLKLYGRPGSRNVDQLRMLTRDISSEYIALPDRRLRWEELAVQALSELGDVPQDAYDAVEFAINNGGEGALMKIATGSPDTSHGRAHVARSILRRVHQQEQDRERKLDALRDRGLVRRR